MLILGAGCSLEEPTGLPLARDLASKCYRLLVENQVLRQGDVDDPQNLSAVADAVFEETDHQRHLVDLFPPGRFRDAEPNAGYCIAAALLLEGAVSNVMTLNFDLAASAALTQLSARGSIPTIRGPDDHHLMGAQNLIYLHRDINYPADDLILRSAALESEWQGAWEVAITQRVIGAPATVFVGLGNPAGVLVETARRISTALQATAAEVYVVDPIDPEGSDFVAALGSGRSVPIKLGWGEFMRRLAARVVKEHRAATESTCQELIVDNELEDEDVQGLCERLALLGLVTLGRLRASWLLEKRSYLEHQEATLRQLSDLLLAVGTIERVSGTVAHFGADGLVRFVGTDRQVVCIICSGGGSRNRTGMETEVAFRRNRSSLPEPSFAVVAHFAGTGAWATPKDLIGVVPENDVARGAAGFPSLSLSELRAGPERIRELVA